MVGKPSPESERLDGELMRRVVDGVPAILSYWGPDQRCRFANRAYERWFGVSPESMVGQHAREFLGPAYPLLLPHIKAALRGEPQQFERDLPGPSGGPARQSLGDNGLSSVARIPGGGLWAVGQTTNSDGNRATLILHHQ